MIFYIFLFLISNYYFIFAKKILFMYKFFILIIGLSLFSCSGTKDFNNGGVVQKRKYRNGYYFSFLENKEKDKLAENKINHLSYQHNLNLKEEFLNILDIMDTSIIEVKEEVNFIQNVQKDTLIKYSDIKGLTDHNKNKEIDKESYLPEEETDDVEPRVYRPIHKGVVYSFIMNILAFFALAFLAPISLIVAINSLVKIYKTKKYRGFYMAIFNLIIASILTYLFVVIIAIS
jgi:hypothetical protein